MDMPVKQTFFDELQKNTKLLAALFQAAIEWYKSQQTVNLPPSSESGPREWHAGEEVKLTTVPLSDTQIDALYKGYAEAVVIEKAIEYVKGFIAGIMLTA